MDRHPLDSLDSHLQFVTEVLRKLHVPFRNYFNFQSISPQLRLHNLLTEDEWQVISKKDSREQQADEFLKCLPQKGKNCLNELVICLQSSHDHSGHKDLLTELKKLLEKQTGDPIANIENDDPQGSAQNGFEKIINEFTSTISNFHFHETKTLKQQIEQKNAEITKLQLTFNTTIQQLKETVSVLQTSNEDLESKLQEKERLLEKLRNNSEFEEGESFEICEEETSPDSILCQKRSYSELPNQRHAEVTRTLSVEDKMKHYQKKLKIYHEKCQSLEVEKKSLENDKFHLKWEVSRLKAEVDTISIAGGLSHHKGLDQSSFSLNQVGSRDECSKSTVEGISSYFSRFTSFIKIPGKRTPRTAVAPEPQPNAMTSEMTDLLPEDANYLNPVHQGWLTKEGGKKKTLKRRWCVLSSRFFFYFEKEDDPKPVGILPLTNDMGISAKENRFEIFNKSRTFMNSCKLDRSKNSYVQGKHASYVLYASCEEDKKKWIEVFQKVFETLKLS